MKRRAAVLVPALLLALFPATGATFYAELVTKVMILAIFAMSLDLLVGVTGLVSFGHAAFFGIGAYTLALLSPRYDPAELWPTLVAAVAVSAACAALVGALAVRVKGIYFIMVTLAFAQLFYFVFHDTELGRGSDGITMNFKPVWAMGPVKLLSPERPLHAYYLVYAFLVATFVFLRVLRTSPFGRALQGIKSNEHRMRSLGFRVYRYKLAAFALAGGLAGLAGYLSAMQYGFTNPYCMAER